MENPTPPPSFTARRGRRSHRQPPGAEPAQQHAHSPPQRRATHAHSPAARPRNRRPRNNARAPRARPRNNDGAGRRLRAALRFAPPLEADALARATARRADRRRPARQDRQLLRARARGRVGRPAGWWRSRTARSCATSSSPTLAHTPSTFSALVVAEVGQLIDALCSSPRRRKHQRAQFWECPVAFDPRYCSRTRLARRGHPPCDGAQARRGARDGRHVRGGIALALGRGLAGGAALRGAARLAGARADGRMVAAPLLRLAAARARGARIDAAARVRRQAQRLSRAG